MRLCASLIRLLSRWSDEAERETTARTKASAVASECLAIEDSPPGIQSARAAGMRTLGITNTVSAEALRAAGADVVTASLADWTVDAVKRLY
jgi:beta-phosphoglucomutase-like phosphatase (HAD superfamily)